MPPKGDQTWRCAVPGHHAATVPVHATSSNARRININDVMSLLPREALLMVGSRAMGDLLVTATYGTRYSGMLNRRSSFSSLHLRKDLGIPILGETKLRLTDDHTGYSSIAHLISCS